MKILIATKNPAKLKEISKYLGDRFETIPLANFPDAPDVEETGATFEENALLKARAYFKFAGIPLISDDGGFEIDALGGEPGVKSRRWPTDEEISAGILPREKTDEELIALALHKLRGVSKEKRTARLRIALAYYDGKKSHTVSRSVEGVVPLVSAKKWDRGFPFRAIFFIPRFGKLYQDLSPEEHEKINHRRAAVEELKKILAESIVI